MGLGIALISGNAFAQQGDANAARPAQAQANFADGDVPGPIDSLQDLEDTGKIVFKMADMDNNGLVSQKEAVDLGNTAVGGFFFRADANGDGKITKDEADQLREELFRQRPWLRVVVQKANAQQRRDGQPDARAAIQGVLNLLDSNNDKALEATEVRQIVASAVQGLYSTADTDRDGQLSPTEVNGAIVGITRAAGQAMFTAADKDQNGQLSREEFLESLKEPASTVFAVLDANSDDQLSQQEMDRAQRVIGSQLRALQVPEPANSATNLIRTGRTPEQVAPVPNVRIPNPAQGRAVQPAPAFGDEKVVLGPEAQIDDVRRAVFHQLHQLRFVEQVTAALAHPRGDVAEELIHQWPDSILGFAPLEIGPQQPDAAVDVVTAPSGRDDAPFLRVGGGDSTDAESVAPVDVGHGQAGLLDAR